MGENPKPILSCYYSGYSELANNSSDSLNIDGPLGYLNDVVQIDAKRKLIKCIFRPFT